VDVALKQSPSASREVADGVCGCFLEKAASAGYAGEADIPPADSKRFAKECRPKLNGSEVRAACVDAAMKQSAQVGRELADRVCGCALDKAVAAGFATDKEIPSGDMKRFTAECTSSAVNSPEARAMCVDAAQKKAPQAPRATLESRCGCMLDKLAAAGSTSQSPVPEETKARIRAECKASSP
jgi:hypothetical protein